MAVSSRLPTKRRPSRRSVKDYDHVEDIRNALIEEDWIPPHLDPATSEPVDIDAEAKRLMVLKSYDVLDSDREDPSFQEIAKMAQKSFQVPMSFICLVDLGIIWTKSAIGFAASEEMPRYQSLASHALHRKKDLSLFIVKDTLADNRFKNNPMVTSSRGPKIRFYAAAPIVTPEGQTIGVLSIADTVVWPEGLSVFEEKRLREMASMVAFNIIMDSHR